MLFQTRTLVGAAGAALVLGVVVWFATMKPTPHGTIEVSAVERNWSVEVSEVRQ